MPNAAWRWLVIGAVSLLLAAPFVAFALNAFAIRWFFPQVWPQVWSLTAWERLFRPSTDVWAALGNSVQIAVGVTFLSLIIGFPAGRVLGLYSFAGKRLVEVLIVLPTLIPPIAFSLGMSVQFIRWGLSGNLFGVMLAHLVPVLPYVVLTLIGVFANYNTDYEAAARSLGANGWAVWVYITLPLLWPGVMTAALFAFLISWSQYLLTFLIGQGQVITLPVLLFSAMTGNNLATIAALALIFVLPAALIVALTARGFQAAAAPLPMR